MQIAVILPAAGQGKRFVDAARARGDDAAAHKSKIELDLAGRPVFQRAIELFRGRAEVAQIILAVSPDAVEEFRFKWGDALGFHNVTLVAGGEQERWETVHKALGHVDGSCTHAAIHDAVRPLASAKLIDRVFETAKRHGAVIPATPINGTLKRVVDVGDDAAAGEEDSLDAILGSAGKDVIKLQRVEQTIDRAGLVEVQTPQVFELALLRRAYARIANDAMLRTVTDDAGLVEAMGEPVIVVEGEATNLKITRPNDLKLAEAIHQSLHKADEALAARKRLFGDEDE